MRSDGQVMKRNFCQRAGAVDRGRLVLLVGIASRPATRISVQNGSDFQMCTSIAIDSASVGSLSQFGPVRRRSA